MENLAEQAIEAGLEEARMQNEIETLKKYRPSTYVKNVLESAAIWDKAKYDAVNLTNKELLS